MDCEPGKQKELDDKRSQFSCSEICILAKPSWNESQQQLKQLHNCPFIAQYADLL